MTLAARTTLVATVLATALVAWIAASEQMGGMARGPVAFAGIWVTMMAAMMLPSAIPAVLAVADIRGPAAGWVFAGGYLVAWSASGLVAYAAYRDIPRWAAGVALVAAGAYQLTPLKNACLRRCRSPLFLFVRGAPGPLGALRIGVEHAGYCMGCCAGLMAALFALGLMSVPWMAVVATAILAEKVLPGGERLALLTGAALVAVGTWVLVT